MIFYAAREGGFLLNMGFANKREEFLLQN